MKSPAPLPLGTSSTRHMTEEMSKFAAIDTSESTEAAGIVPAGFRRSSDGSGGRTIHTRGHISGADVFPESHEMPVSARAGFMSNLARQDDSPVASNTARGGDRRRYEGASDGASGRCRGRYPETCLREIDRLKLLEGMK